MSTNIRLDIRSQQTLTMTPQLQQAIKLLQLSSQELSQFLQQQIMDNPLLMVEEAKGSALKEQASDEGEDSWESLSNPDYENLFHDQGDSGRAPHTEWGESSLIFESRGHWEGEDSPYAKMAAPESFRDNFLSQIRMEFRNPKDTKIAEKLFEYLDETGYLNPSYTEIADQNQVSTDYLEKIIRKLQKFEPGGLFCRSLQEFLALQLDNKGKLNPRMKKFLNHLHFLENQDFANMTKESGLSLDECREFLAEIRQLNPKPVTNPLEIEDAAELIPEVLMVREPNGQWDVTLNPHTMPKILVNSGYYDLILKSIHSKEERDFLMQQLQSANWLLKALQQRSMTVLKVSREIVKRQKKFFDEGEEFLKPLALKDIAESLEIHESTVSRVTNNKYIATPRGIFEFKYFFSASISSHFTTESFAAKAIQKKIQSMVAKEDPLNPLSDEQIVNILTQDGVQVARRTVAKYREALHIPSSVNRKRQKKFQLTS